MKNMLLAVSAAAVLMTAGFVGLVLLVGAVLMPSVAQQLGVLECTTPVSAKADAAGQVQILATGNSVGVVSSTGADIATTTTSSSKQTVRAPLPRGYAATAPTPGLTEAARRDTAGGGPRVLWRTDVWTKTATGPGPAGSVWVTLRSVSSRHVSVIGGGDTPPAAGALQKLVARLGGTVVVTGPTSRWTHLHHILGVSGLVTSAQTLHKPSGALFVATAPTAGLRPVSHQVTAQAGLLVGLSEPGQHAATGAATPPGTTTPHTGTPHTRTPQTTAPETVAPGSQEGGVGFALPAPGRPRKASLSTPARPIPGRVKALYRAAAARYKLPWTLLAGIGMAETDHGRNNATSSAGARGLMQFMPATFARYGVDGDHDGRTDIGSDADSVFAAANYLTASGVTKGAAGVRRALLAYNHAAWYVNDVLAYAAAYGGGTVLGDPTDTCPAGGQGNPGLPALSTGRARTLLAWGQHQLGEPYVFGANGPTSWDCSSFSRTAYAQIGITLPRTAQAQRDWLAHGNGYRVPAARARPGDLVFTDTYRGPNAVGHVMVVFNPATGTSIEAGGAKVQYLKYTRYAHHHIFEIWRVGNIADHPSTT